MSIKGIENEGYMLITAYIPVAWNRERKFKGLTWRGLIKVGLDSATQQTEMKALIDDYKELQERQIRTRDLLEKFIKEGRSDKNVLG